MQSDNFIRHPLDYPARSGKSSSASRKHLHIAISPTGGMGQVHFLPGGSGFAAEISRIKVPSPFLALRSRSIDLAAARDRDEPTG
jgi:hypothetical protein